MQTSDAVPPEAWEAAGQKLVIKEKGHTRAGDADPTIGGETDHAG